MCSPAFLDWCINSGIDTSAVTPALIPVGPSDEQHSYRGLVAARPLQPGDAICVVPASLLLSATTSAPRDPVLGPLLLARRRSPPLTHHQTLCVHLLHEASKRAGSAWRPYLRELPRSYSVLAAWPRAASDALQAPHARRACARAERSARREWEGARGVLLEALLGKAAAAAAAGETPPLPHQQQQQQQQQQQKPTTAPTPFSSWRAWLWAHGSVLSRTMHLPGDAAGCLTPLGDLLNHAAPRGGAPWAPDPLEEIAGLVLDGGADDEDAETNANAEKEEEEEEQESAPAGDGAFDSARGAYVLRTRRRLAPGDEALLSYGRHTNLELLALYGFLLPPGAPANPDDRAPLPRRHVRAAMAGGGGDGDGGDGGGDGNASSSDEEDGAGIGSSSDRLASHGGGASSWYVQAADGRPSWALFEALSRAAALAAATATGRPPPASSSPQSLLNQALTVERWLRAACLATLRELPSTLEEDEAWLAEAATARSAVASGKKKDDDDEEGASASRDGGGADKKKEEAATSSEHDAECLRLAVEWRLQYKRALLRCVSRCDRALAKGVGGGAAAGDDDDERQKQRRTTTAALQICRGHLVALPTNNKKM